MLRCLLCPAPGPPARPSSSEVITPNEGAVIRESDPASADEKPVVTVTPNVGQADSSSSEAKPTEVVLEKNLVTDSKPANAKSVDTVEKPVHTKTETGDRKPADTAAAEEDDDDGKLTKLDDEYKPTRRVRR